MVCKTRGVVSVKSSGERAGADDKFGWKFDNMHADISLIFAISSLIYHTFSLDYFPLIHSLSVNF